MPAGNVGGGDLPVLKKGAFYRICESGAEFVLEDRTKRGLEARERSADPRLGVDAEMGMIHDMDGIGHRVPIRWFFPKASFGMDRVVTHAEDMEQRYAEMRELTCPDDDDDGGGGDMDSRD